MFTGLIEEIGVVSRRSGFDLAIMATTVLDGLNLGDSVAVNGVCLTVSATTDSGFVVDTSPETLARTTLARMRPGDAVNLERAMQAGGRFGGHFVLGHIDGVGRVAAIQDQGKFSLWRFQAPSEVAAYLAPKGSVAIDGVSLTIVNPKGDEFEAAIIPETLKRTTLGAKRPGDAINLEADIIGKHIYHYMRNMTGGSGITRDFLAGHGFI